MIDIRSKYFHNNDIRANFDNLVIKLTSEINVCPICKRKINVLKTQAKTCYSYKLGKFELLERLTYCKDHKYTKINSNSINKYHSELGSEIVCKDFKITYDLIVKIGLLRWHEHKQLKEIQNYLKYGYASFDLPISTIGLISKRFLEFCKMLHTKYEYKIKFEIKTNGGYVLHFDGTTEKRSKEIVFVIKDSISGHVLNSTKIKSESIDEIKPSIEEVKQKYGQPLLTISDLKPGFKQAVDEIFLQEVIHLFCHYHFSGSFDKCFQKDYRIVKQYIVKYRLKTKLSLIASDILNEIEKLKNQFVKKEIIIWSDIQKYWEESQNILQTYYYVIEWVLKYKKDSSGKGFPFDLPYFDLYLRLIRAKKFISQIFIKDNQKTKINGEDFNEIISKLLENKLFVKSTRMVKFIREWFNKLRATLYMQPIDKTRENIAPLSEKYKLNLNQAEQIPDNIETFLEDLTKQIDTCNCNEKRDILKIFQKKILKYKTNLTVPVFNLNIKGKEKKFIPERTNNCLEQSFRTDKSILRRITGREQLTKEFDAVGDLLPYYTSMKNKEIFKSMFEDEEQLTQEFASLFFTQKASGEKLLITNDEIKKINVNYYTILAYSA